MTTTTKLTNWDDRFVRLVADASETPGFCYAKSWDREYNGFNDDYQAENYYPVIELYTIVQSPVMGSIAIDVMNHARENFCLFVRAVPEIFLRRIQF